MTTPTHGETAAHVNSHVLSRPEWVPEHGHSPAKIGIYFGAIRITGERSVEVGEALMEACSGQPGAIVFRTSDQQVTYFLTPPGSGKNLRWPPGIVDLGHAERDEYIIIPALTGNTDPWSWWSPPTADGDGQFVSASVLHRVVCGLLHWPEAAVTS